MIEKFYLEAIRSCKELSPRLFSRKTYSVKRHFRLDSKFSCLSRRTVQIELRRLIEYKEGNYCF